MALGRVATQLPCHYHSHQSDNGCPRRRLHFWSLVAVRPVDPRVRGMEGLAPSNLWEAATS